MTLNAEVHLAWFAIWKREDRSRQKGKQRQDGDTPPGEREGEVGEDEHDSSGILYSYTAANQASEDISRRVGLAQGLIDFTSSFASSSDAPTSTGGTSTMRVVHSQNQRLCFINPEDDFWINASFFEKSPTEANMSTNHVRDSSNTSSIASPGPSSAARGHTRRQIQYSNQIYLNHLYGAYLLFKLANGTFLHLEDTLSKDLFKDKLRTYWDAWCGDLPLTEPLMNPHTASKANAATRMPLLGLPISPYQDHLQTLLHSSANTGYHGLDEEEPPDASEISDDLNILLRDALVVHTTGLLYHPPISTDKDVGRPMTFSDMLALATYLYSLLPPNGDPLADFDTTLSAPDSKAKAAKSKKSKTSLARNDRRSSSSGSWKTTFTGFGTYLGLGGKSESANSQARSPSHLDVESTPSSATEAGSSAPALAATEEPSANSGFSIPTLSFPGFSSVAGLRMGSYTASTPQTHEEINGESTPGATVTDSATETPAQDSEPSKAEPTDAPQPNDKRKTSWGVPVINSFFNSKPNNPPMPESPLYPQKDEHAAQQNNTPTSTDTNQKSVDTNVDSDSLYHAIEEEMTQNIDGLILEEDYKQTSSTASAKVEVKEPIKFFLGSESIGIWLHTTLCFTDSVAIAYFHPLDAERLTECQHEALESYLLSVTEKLKGSQSSDVSEGKYSKYYQATSTGPGGWVEILNQNSSSMSTIHNKLSNEINASETIHKFRSGAFSSLFLRTSQSSWLVGSKAATLPSTHNTPKSAEIVILPKSIGKEGSLVDADSKDRTCLKAVPGCIGNESG